MNTTKTKRIRGVQHELVSNGDSFWQYVPLGCKPNKWDWHLSEQTAYREALRQMDRQNKALDRSVGYGDEEHSRLNVFVHRDMELYSGWGWAEHVKWICEATGLPYDATRAFVDGGGCLLTDEHCSVVVAMAVNSVEAKTKTIFRDEEDVG